jgi:general L-amino acid transport system substrate-binding protein
VTLAVAIALASCSLAHAGPVVDRITSSGVIRCGGVSRPGLVGQSPNDAPSGLYLDLCRAIGAALLGSEGRIEFHPYDSDRAFARVADGADDLFFSTDRRSPNIGSPAPQRSGPRSISSRPPQWFMGQRRSSN